MANYTYPNIPAQLNPGDIVYVRYTGSVVSWKPSDNGVTKIKVDCHGAKGYKLKTGDLKTYSGGSTVNIPVDTNITGGRGGHAAGIIVAKTETLFFSVGEEGSYTKTSTFGNGGAYGGGGCTWIAKQTNPTSKDHLYIVAGGGGATGYYGGKFKNGGAGGGLIGENGGHTPSGVISYGSQTTGGAGISDDDGIVTDVPGGTIAFTSSQNNGSFLKGGNGGNGSDHYGPSLEYGSGLCGGGGSGLYGGGGRYGGGGSSYIGGVQEGITNDGTTAYGNDGNGFIRILIMKDTIEVNITVKDKKPVYTSPEPVKFTINASGPIAKLDVKFGNQLIKSISNPIIDDSFEYNVDVSNEMFLNGSNGTNYVEWVCYDETDSEIYTHVEKFNKYSNDMIIITEPILIAGPELAVDLNIDLKYIEHNDNIKIFVCNNAYDDTPTWEDVTARILNKLNILTTNRKKTNENWGLSFKIEVTGPFELSEDFIGGFYVHGFDTPPTLAPEQQDEPNVYRNTPWGTYLHKQASMEAEKEILLMELSEDINVLTDEEKDIDHYKELYEKGFITETQFNRIMKINK